MLQTLIAEPREEGYLRENDIRFQLLEEGRIDRVEVRALRLGGAHLVIDPLGRRELQARGRHHLPAGARGRGQPSWTAPQLGHVSPPLRCSLALLLHQPGRAFFYRERSLLYLGMQSSAQIRSVVLLGLLEQTRRELRPGTAPRGARCGLGGHRHRGEILGEVAFVRTPHQHLAAADQRQDLFHRDGAMSRVGDSANRPLLPCSFLNILILVWEPYVRCHWFDVGSCGGLHAPGKAARLYPIHAWARKDLSRAKALHGRKIGLGGVSLGSGVEYIFLSRMSSAVPTLHAHVFEPRARRPYREYRVGLERLR